VPYFPEVVMDHEESLRILAGIVAANPKLRRNRVYCHICGHSEAVNRIVCMREGWPKHCNVQMSINTPDERRDVLAMHKKPKKKPKSP
jgi:hypothetical protein